MGGLRFLDEDGNEVKLDPAEADVLWRVTDECDAATISACPLCRCRVLAAVALVDMLEAAPPLPRSRELVDLADDAPTLHLYVEEIGTTCGHRRWRDPLYDEWADIVDE
jgi:hypothetical protein